MGYSLLISSINAGTSAHTSWTSRKTTLSVLLFHAPASPAHSSVDGPLALHLGHSMADRQAASPPGSPSNLMQPRVNISLPQNGQGFSLDGRGLCLLIVFLLSECSFDPPSRSTVPTESPVMRHIPGPQPQSFRATVVAGTHSNTRHTPILHIIIDHGSQLAE